MNRSKSRSRNARGRFTVSKPLNVTSESQIPMLESIFKSPSYTFVLIYADWCGHCQTYKPMWETLTRTPGRTANMAAVREDVLPKVPSISKAKIQGYPSVIKVSPNGKIEEYSVNGETTNAIDSSKMRNMDEMRKEITIPSPSNVPSPEPTTKAVPAKEESEDIYTPVTSLSRQQGFKKGSFSPGSLLTSEDIPQTGGGLSIAASFISAIQAAGPAALLLAAHSLLPKRSRTYKSPKRYNRRGGTRRVRRH
jgi:hypothetical protein